MSNLGDSNTPIEGQSFGLPAGAELGEDNGDVVIKDSSGTIILRRNETASEWQFEGTNLSGINAIDASSATLGSGTIAAEATEGNEIPQFSQVAEAGNEIFYQNDRPDPFLDAIWFIKREFAQSERLTEFNTLSGSVDSVSLDDYFTIAGDNSGSVSLYTPSQSELWNLSRGTETTSVDVSKNYATASVDDSGYVFDAMSGDELLEFSNTNIDFMPSSAVASSVVVFGGNDNVAYRIDPSDGSEIWTFTAGNSINSLDLSDDGTLCAVLSRDGFAYLLDASDGTENWSFDTTDAFPYDISVELDALSNGAVAIGGDSGTIWLRDLSDGSAVWSNSYSNSVEGVGVSENIAVAAVPQADTAYVLDVVDGSELFSTSITGVTGADVTGDVAAFGGGSELSWHAGRDTQYGVDIAVGDGERYGGVL